MTQAYQKDLLIAPAKGDATSGMQQAASSNCLGHNAAIGSEPVLPGAAIGGASTPAVYSTWDGDVP
jgi:hypothetical protein